MGTGSGPGGLNSRIFTNSFAGQSSAMAYPFKPNNYFYWNWQFTTKISDES
jgi:hypothetical protein